MKELLWKTDKGLLTYYLDIGQHYTLYRTDSTNIRVQMRLVKYMGDLYYRTRSNHIIAVI